jgi:hypothetical protein
MAAVKIGVLTTDQCSAARFMKIIEKGFIFEAP